MGLIDSNYYSLKNGIDTSLVTVTTKEDGSNYIQGIFEFPSLNNTFGIEKHSKNVVNTGTLEYNASNTPKIVNFPGMSKKDVFGKVYNNSVTIAAWKSMVLIPNGETASDNKAPIADAGVNQIILLPTNTIKLVGKGTDADGTISQYFWRKISGPQTSSIVTPSISNAVLFNLVAGVYKYELMVTDNDGLTGKDTVQINVNSNLLPAVNPANTTNG